MSEYRRRTASRSRGRRARKGSSREVLYSTSPARSPRAARPSRTTRTAGEVLYGTRPVRRRNPLPALLALTVVLAVLAGVFVFTRPLSAEIEVYPTDSRITSLETSATGKLSLDDLSPGRYPILLERQGFESKEAVISVRRFSANSFKFELTPQPQSLSVTVVPPDAEVTVVGPDAEEATGVGAIETTLAAGPKTLTISLDGYNTYQRDIWLEGPVALRVHLDPAGQLVSCLGIVDSEGAPKAVAVTPDGSEMWATILNGPPAIEIYDVATVQRVSTIELGTDGAVEIVFTADGSRAYASQMETALVYEIDTATRTVLRALDTQSAWTKVVALSPDERTLYAANWSGDDVSVIDLTTGTCLKRIRTADTPRGLWPTADGKSLYVAGFGGGELQRIDLASGSVTTLFDSNGALRHIVGDDQRGVLLISDMARDCIWRHDIATGQTTRFIETDAKPNTIDLSPDGRVLFVSCRGANNPKSYYIPGPEWGSILLFDALDGNPLDAIIGGNQCTALDVSGDGKVLAFSDFLDDRIRLFAVPAYDVLVNGNGGRWEQHFAEIHK